MKYKCKRFGATAIFGLVILCGSVFGQETSTLENAVLKAVSDDDRPSFYKAFSAAFDDRAFNDKLVDILKAPKSSEFQKSAAAFILGNKRYLLAIDALVENVLLEDTVGYDESRDGRTLMGQYPACLALLKIGYPAARALTAKLINTYNKAEQERCIMVLTGFFESREMIKCYLRSYCKTFNIPDKSNDYDDLLKSYTEPFEGLHIGNTDSGGTK